jgi:hypothetical protein
MDITLDDLAALMRGYQTALQAGDWSAADRLHAEFEAAEEAFLSDTPCCINDEE